MSMVIVNLTLPPFWCSVCLAVAFDGIWVTHDHDASPGDTLLLLNLLSRILFQSVTMRPQLDVHERSPWVGPCTVAEQPLDLAVVHSALGSQGLQSLSSSSVSPRLPPYLAFGTLSRGIGLPSPFSPIVLSMVFGSLAVPLRG
ncbi:hypothetical protein EV401DRAFT_1930319 [Pisolithus croceorrhizus]|nr:hypothetical protein EV401DRAFT_1930319 [Pisolithus croceorrhizus]